MNANFPHYNNHSLEPLVDGYYQKAGIVMDATGQVLPYPLKTMQMKVRAAFFRGGDGKWYRNSRHTLREPRWHMVAPEYLEVWIPKHIIGLGNLMAMG